MLVELFYTTRHLFFRFLEFCHTLAVGFLDYTMHPPLLQEFDTGPEGNKLFKSCHVDTVIVGITDLGR